MPDNLVYHDYYRFSLLHQDGKKISSYNVINYVEIEAMKNTT